MLRLFIFADKRYFVVTAPGADLSIRAAIRRTS
jgi:hypothetical protein